MVHQLCCLSEIQGTLQSVKANTKSFETRPSKPLLDLTRISKHQTTPEAQTSNDSSVISTTSIPPQRLKPAVSHVPQAHHP
eukprot:1161980-Pelagomonas_calceolata.AAC.1